MPGGGSHCRPATQTMALESTIVTDNQNRGTPTLAGAGETRLTSAANSIMSLFGRAADVVTSARDAFADRDRDNDGAAVSQPVTPVAQQAKTFFEKWGLLIGLGVAALVGVLLITRR